MSPRIGNVTPFCCANAWLAKGLSMLTPRTWVSAASSLARFAWKAFISFVHPPVKAKTKNASATCFLPLNSCSETGVILEPSYASSVKSGAMSPILIFSGSGAFFGSSAAKAAVAASAMAMRIAVSRLRTWDTSLRDILQSKPMDATLTVVEPHAAPGSGIRDLWASRELLYFLVWRDVKVRYRQTLVGVAWAVLQPLLAMVILTLFFGRPAQLPSEGIPYPLFAYAGLLAWTFFANALFSSSNSIVGNGPLITKIYFPRLLVPAGAVGARLVDFGIAALLMAVLMAWYRAPVTPRLLLLPLLVVITMMLSLACGLWLSALNVKYRDVNFALPHVLQFLMFATPVFYSTTMLPDRLRGIAGANPLAILIAGYRAALFGRPFDVPALSMAALFTL